jgi:hypothetical protein
MTIKIIKEVKLNGLLRAKHQLMRIKSVSLNIGFIKRIGVLTSTALAPIAVIAVIVLVGTNSNTVPSGELRTFDDSNDITKLYESISGVLPRYSSTEYSMDVPYNDEPEYNISSVEGDNYDAVATTHFLTGLERTYSSGEVVGEDQYSTLLHNDDYYYEVVGTSIEITVNSNEGTTKTGTQFVDSINYSNWAGACNENYFIKGMYLDEDYLTVVLLEYPISCIGIDLDSQYVFENMNILVSVINIDDLSDAKNYRLNGNLNGVIYDNGYLYVTTKRFLNYDEEGFNIENYLPYYEIDGIKIYKDYSEIVYIEGTVPNSYTSVYSIELGANIVDHEVLLVDYYYDTHISSSGVEFIGTIYYFETMAAVFELEDTIEESKKITITLNFETGNIVYEGIEIK